MHVGEQEFLDQRQVRCKEKRRANIGDRPTHVAHGVIRRNLQYLRIGEEIVHPVGAIVPLPFASHVRPRGAVSGNRYPSGCESQWPAIRYHPCSVGPPSADEGLQRSRQVAQEWLAPPDWEIVT